jgi:hypothetical protein
VAIDLEDTMLKWIGPHVPEALASWRTLVEDLAGVPLRSSSRIGFVDLKVQRVEETAQLHMVLEATWKEAQGAQKLAEHRTRDMGLHILAIQKMKERNLQRSGSTPH